MASSTFVYKTRHFFKAIASDLQAELAAASRDENCLELAEDGFTERGRSKILESSGIGTYRSLATRFNPGAERQGNRLRAIGERELRTRIESIHREPLNAVAKTNQRLSSRQQRTD